eukprot:98745-Chlamydomonas_euryale.AAC.1
MPCASSPRPPSPRTRKQALSPLPAAALSMHSQTGTPPLPAAAPSTRSQTGPPRGRHSHALANKWPKG